MLTLDMSNECPQVSKYRQGRAHGPCAMVMLHASTYCIIAWIVWQSYEQCVPTAGDGSGNRQSTYRAIADIHDMYVKRQAV